MPLQRAWSCELGGSDAETVGGFSTSVPRRGFSLSLGPDLGEFRHEGIEQTGREKPIGVEIARAGEGAQVEARPGKFVHLVDDNP